MPHSKRDLSIYLLERARQDLKAAKKLLDANDTYKQVLIGHTMPYSIQVISKRSTFCSL